MSNRKYLLWLSVCVFSLLSLTSTVEGSSVYKLDAKSSTINWSLTDLNGKEQKGDLKFKSGNLQIDSKRITGGFFYVNLQTLACTSITDVGFNKDLIEWMRGVSNLNAIKQKEVKIKLTRATRKDVEDGEDNFQVTAVIDIKGVKQSIDFPAKVKFGKKTNMIATFTINGASFNMEHDLNLKIDVNFLKP